MTSESGPEKTQGKFVPAFDGIRGSAVLWVVFYHFVTIEAVFGAAPHTVAYWLSLLASVGWIGVQIFFALSGFLITGILFDSLDDPQYFRNFYARRTLRIFPLYYGSLLVLFLLTPILHLNWQGRGWVWPLYLQYAVQVHGVLAPHVDITHFWSLAIEEQFYLFWPLVVYLLRESKKLLWAAGILSVGSLLLRMFLYERMGGSIRLLMPCELDALLIGGAAAIVLRTRHGEWLLKLAPSIFLLALTPLVRQFVVMRLNFEDNRWSATWGFTLMAIASTGLLLWSYRQGTIASRALSFRPLRFVGKYSYGIYIYNSLIRSLVPVLAAKLKQVGLGYGARTALASSTVCVFTVGLAYVSYTLYESRFLKMKRLFGYSRKRTNVSEPKRPIVTSLDKAPEIS